MDAMGRACRDSDRGFVFVLRARKKPDSLQREIRLRAELFWLQFSVACRSEGCGIEVRRVGGTHWGVLEF